MKHFHCSFLCVYHFTHCFDPVKAWKQGLQSTVWFWSGFVPIINFFSVAVKKYPCKLPVGPKTGSESVAQFLGHQKQSRIWKSIHSYEISVENLTLFNLYLLKKAYDSHTSKNRNKRETVAILEVHNKRQCEPMCIFLKWGHYKHLSLSFKYCHYSPNRLRARFVVNGYTPSSSNRMTFLRSFWSASGFSICTNLKSTDYMFYWA